MTHQQKMRHPGTLPTEITRSIKLNCRCFFNFGFTGIDVKSKQYSHNSNKLFDNVYPHRLGKAHELFLDILI